MPDNTIITTGKIVLPVPVAQGIWKKAQSTSVLARLANAEPQLYGDTKVMVLNGAPKAELVGEGIEKSPTTTGYTSKTVTPHKLQITVRVTDEVLWADTDYQLGIMQDVSENMGIALGRALDIVGIHKANPLSGQVAQSVTEGIIDTQNTVTVTNKPDASIEAAVALIIANGYIPNGIAFEPGFAFSLANQRDDIGRKLYPEMGFGQTASNFEGLTAAVGDTVSGVKELATPADALAIVGDYSAFRWGVQRFINAQVIEYGDPDGLGDLQRLNQVAIRSEIVYGIGIMDTDAFAIVNKDNS